MQPVQLACHPDPGFVGAGDRGRVQRTTDRVHGRGKPRLGLCDGRPHRRVRHRQREAVAHQTCPEVTNGAAVRSPGIRCWGVR
jgi:hypothetical protein